MAKKTWPAYAASRKDHPGEWECVTKPDPSTALNPERLEYLKGEAEKVGLLTDIRPLVPGKRPMGLFVCYPNPAPDYSAPIYAQHNANVARSAAYRLPGGIENGLRQTAS